MLHVTIVDNGLSNIMDLLSADGLITTTVCSVDQVAFAFAKLTTVVVCCRRVNI